MSTFPKCNGYSSPRETFSESTRSLIKERLVVGRALFHNRAEFFGGLHFGARFNDDESALVRIESAAKEEEVLSNLDEWVWAALEDCASSDHWYAYEKQWE
jgi:hypothetical protein